VTDPLEDELRRRLRRVDPPEGFAERVLARAAAGRRRPVGTWAVPAALAACVLVSLGAFAHVQERRQALTAKNEALLALRIAGAELRHAKAKTLHRTKRESP
jgi:hypothetical protein